MSTAADPKRTDGLLARRAWSRDGAIATVLASGPTRRILRFSTRVFLLVAGSLAIAGSVAVMLWNELGPGPLDVFIGAVRIQTGLPLSLAIWLTMGSVIAVAWTLGRRPGFGTLLSPLLVGPAMQLAVAALETIERPDAFIVRLVIQLLAVTGIGLGAGALIVSGLGAGSGELLASAASDRSGRPEPRVRTAFELSWLVVGVALGGPVGLGTIVVALTIGPAVAAGYRVVDAAIAHSRRRFDPSPHVCVGISVGPPAQIPTQT